MRPLQLSSDLTQRLRHVRSVGAITGAGVSSESGIRTYRGSGGIYDDPEEGRRTVEALSAAGLAADPDRTWRTVASLAQQALAALPNPGHTALVDIERSVRRFVLLTQNVDGLHQLAGSRNVIDIHGNVFAMRCGACPSTGRLGREQLAGLRSSPRCDTCGERMRPDAVLFGEMLPASKVERIGREFHDDPPDLVLVAGTSALFPYITEPVIIARAAGRLTVEVNLEATLLSDHVDHALRGPAGSVLPSIAEVIGSRG